MKRSGRRRGEGEGGWKRRKAAHSGACTSRDQERGGTGKEESRKERNCGLAGGRTLTKRERS